jgi:gamma-glutamyl:cysteine ligase YbdK (ATP-grasp superfamily)
MGSTEAVPTKESERPASEDRYGLFERFGIELEYMIVDAESLAVRGIADRLLTNSGGQPVSEIQVGSLLWSNELVLHVLEMKTDEPALSLHGLATAFQQGVNEANRRLEHFGAMLMPGGMHPTMDPVREMRLWPHDYGDVYRTFDRIFDCRGHGWANLQAAHLNLPFRSNDEFARLHAGIRVLLPILPALSASSPILEGRPTGMLDTRLAVYRQNAARVPSVSGSVVPEPADSEEEYQRIILARIYKDLQPLDPDGVLRQEWVNARGAIARFERGTIEIRVLDVQECPVADHAIAAAITAIVRMLAEEVTSPLRAMNALSTERLADLLQTAITDGDAALIDDRHYLDLFGWRRGSPCRARDLWDFLIERYLVDDGPDLHAWERALETILSHGCLARRILLNAQSIGIPLTCRALASCLAHGRQL